MVSKTDICNQVLFNIVNFWNLDKKFCNFISLFLFSQFFLFKHYILTTFLLSLNSSISFPQLLHSQRSTSPRFPWTTCSNKTRHIYQDLTRQSSMRKSVPIVSSIGKSVKDRLSSHFWEFHKNTALHNHKVYAEDQALIHKGSTLVDSVSLKHYISRLVDCVDHGPLCVLDTLGSYKLSFHSSSRLLHQDYFTNV